MEEVRLTPLAIKLLWEVAKEIAKPGMEKQCHKALIKFVKTLAKHFMTYSVPSREALLRLRELLKYADEEKIRRIEWKEKLGKLVEEEWEFALWVRAKVASVEALRTLIAYAYWCLTR